VPVLQHQENRLLASLSREAFARLEPVLKEIWAPQGTVLFGPGERIEQVYFPQSGMISLLVVTNKGDLIETSIIGREGAVGLQRGFGERRSFTRATVQMSGRFSIIAARVFQEISSGTAAIRDMIAHYTEVLWAETQQLAACNAIHDAPSRLCRWLAQSADRANNDELPLTQEFLAQMLGVRRTTVTLLAQELQRKGIIKYARGRITILNRKMLEDSTCECYHVLKADELQFRIGLSLGAG